MPQATDARRAQYRKWFGTIDAGPGMTYMIERGWTYTRDHEWVHDHPQHRATRKEVDVVTFLCHEWDFGGFESLESRHIREGSKER